MSVEGAPYVLAALWERRHPNLGLQALFDRAVVFLLHLLLGRLACILHHIKPLFGGTIGPHRRRDTLHGLKDSLGQ